MPNNRSGRLLFVFVILVLLCVIGRNLSLRHRAAVSVTLISELINAVSLGQADKVRALLEQGVPVNGNGDPNWKRPWHSLLAPVTWKSFVCCSTTALILTYYMAGLQSAALFRS